MNEKYVAETDEESLSLMDWLANLALVFLYVIGVGTCMYYAMAYYAMAADKIGEWLANKRRAFNALCNKWALRLHKFDSMLNIPEDEDE